MGDLQAGEVVQLDAEGGERVSVVVPTDVMAEANEAVAEEETKQRPVARPDAGGIPPAPEPSIAAATSAEPPSPAVPGVATPADDRSAFKVVLSLKPAAEGRWHATIAIGRDGCDPIFEPAEVADWPEALDAVLGVHAAAETRWAEQPRNATAPIKIGGVKPETTVGGAAPASKRKTPDDEKRSAASGETATASGSPTQDAGRRGNGKANQPTNETDRAACRRQGKSAVPASVGKVAATVVDGGVEKLSLF